MQPSRDPEQQRGIVLLLMLLVLTVTGSSFLLAALNDNDSRLAMRRDVYQALSNTREALLAYTTHYPDIHTGTASGPGTLPCANTNNDGDGLPDCPATIGRLPQSVPSDSGGYYLTDAYSGIDQQFWYAVANTFTPAARPINTQTTSDLNYDNTLVAVLIAPGDSLPLQDRSLSTDAAQYLEIMDATGSRMMVDETNDVVIGITRSEMMPFVTLRVAQALFALIETQDMMPNTLSDLLTEEDLPDWIEENEWLTVAHYIRADDDNATISFSGCDNIGYSLTLDPTPGLRQNGQEC